MSKQKMMVQTALMPLYYKDFHCIMGACQDNCCDDGWRIEFDKKDYLKLKHAPKSPELQAMMEKGLFRLRGERLCGEMYAEFRGTEDSRCCFHREDGLCQLQMSCGESCLPEVCRGFPRSSQCGPMGLERSLSPACEGVLALLWDLPQGIEFWEEPLPEKEWKLCVPGNAMQVRFAEIRSLCVDVLQERSLRLPQRLLLLGVLLQKLGELDWETGAGVDGWLAQGEAALHDADLAGELGKLPGNRQMFLSQNHRVMTDTMAATTERRKEIARQLCSAVTTVEGTGAEKVFVYNLDRYQELEEKLNGLPGLGEYFFENLMVAVAFQSMFPKLSSPDRLWKSYVNLCNIYSLYRYAAVCGCAEEVSRERLFRSLVFISREILHNAVRQNKLRDEFFKNDSATLAHMAVLVSG
ncbi:MAG: flagellin lysine-N-methylase [Oscillospiraceae bacterium]|nr:flagellin lysine-N-methylase [Oscillospiraceae bacterium]